MSSRATSAWQTLSQPIRAWASPQSHSPSRIPWKHSDKPAFQKADTAASPGQEAAAQLQLCDLGTSLPLRGQGNMVEGIVQRLVWSEWRMCWGP